MTSKINMNNNTEKKSTELKIESPYCKYEDDCITSEYEYHTTEVVRDASTIRVMPRRAKFRFRTRRKIPKMGLMMVGWGGNNGCTVTGGIIANQKKMGWMTKEGPRQADYFGSVTQSSTLRMGADKNGEEVYIPFKDILPMVDPNDLVLGGWDISKLNLAKAMERSKVFAYDLQRKLAPAMEKLVPLPSPFYPDFVAANQEQRVDNALPGTDKLAHLSQLRKDIREFKANNKLDKVIVLWTANTERFSDVVEGLNDTAENLMASIKNSEDEVSPSTLFAVASILEGCSYVNGSPQNTFVPGVLELAKKYKVFIGGDDFKSGQTKMKSVLVDFLVGAGIKPVSIVSYNHLGNNDGKNLSAPKTFRSKEISKSNVVDDMVASNNILYNKGEHPDHCVVIKYVPFVGDSKRAMDEYTSRIFMGGINTIAMHNTCEDSLLAAPIIMDLAIITELCERIEIQAPGKKEFEPMHPVLSILSYLTKAPLVKDNTPVINALFKQRACMENIFRACLGLQPENNMLLEHKLYD